MTDSCRSDGSAWAAFYLEHRRGLTAYALALTGNVEDARDLIQDVLVRLVRSARSPQNARAYVMRCLRNLAIDRRRAGTASGDDLSIDADAVFDEPNAERGAGEAVELVRSALRRVEPRQREVVIMKIYAEMTFAEIAEATRRSIGSVTSDYARALAEMRAALARNPELTRVVGD